MSDNSASQKLPGIVDLPEELIFYIFSFLSLKELSTVATVNRLFSFIVDNCRTILLGQAKGDSWKEQYLWVAAGRLHKDRKEIVSTVAIKLFNKGSFILQKKVKK